MKNRSLAIRMAMVALVGAACAGGATTAPSPAPTAVPTAMPTQAGNATPTATATLAAAPETQTIHLVDHPTSGTLVGVGSLTGCKITTACQGDYMAGYDPVVDVSTGGEVGTLAYECFLVDPVNTLYHCPGNTITLKGRGQIVFTEVIQHEDGGPSTVAPIIGGTGEFLGATGTVTSTKVSQGADFLIAIAR
jgi:hypothetical protein